MDSSLASSEGDLSVINSKYIINIQNLPIAKIALYYYNWNHLIMAKRQAKLLSSRLFSLATGLCILFSVVLFGLSFASTASVTAEQKPSTAKTPVLFASSLLISPSPTPNFTLPFTENLTAHEEKASDAALLEPPYAEDYCLDVPVVMYHHIQPLQMADLLGHKALTVDSEIFDQQIQYLKDQGYTAITAQDLVSALQNRTNLPEKSIMITIDDGYDDNYTYAFMTAKKHHFLMNFMIPTELIDKTGYMRWEHLQEMVHSPYAKIYNHSTTHAPLGFLTKDQIITEVTHANSDLEAKLGLKNTIVTYPYGSYDNEAIDTLKELEITGAFSTDPGSQQCLSSILRLPRLRIGNAPMSSYGF